MKRNGMYNLGNDAPTDMDSLHYYYKAGTNQLDYVYDAVNISKFIQEIKSLFVVIYGYVYLTELNRWSSAYAYGTSEMQKFIILNK